MTDGVERKITLKEGDLNQIINTESEDSLISTYCSLRLRNNSKIIVKKEPRQVNYLFRQSFLFVCLNVENPFP